MNGEEQRETRREELVLAAYELIAERGFEGLRTRDVADRVGVNIATLHYYFPTKEMLIRGVLNHAMERFRTTLEPHGSPADQLRNHLRAVRRLMTDEPQLGTVMSELALRSRRDAAVRKIVNEMFDTWQAAMRGLLRRAAREGKLRSELNTDAVASMIIGTLMASTLPQMHERGRGDQAVRQLETLLGLSGRQSLQSVESSN
ncbi:MAG TPA: TetR/AcrR family transcriptional regulator [Gemmatimonadales bacterium]|nr:TetR/AcrR family transcriptional regulator [Gemmatimonadales bacterium]